MKLSIGDRVVWQSAAGELNGTIKNVVLSENAKLETVPWIDIQHTNPHYNTTSTTRLCATHSSLLMMQVEKIEA